MKTVYSVLLAALLLCVASVALSKERVVLPGDTLSQIALETKQGGIEQTVQQLADLNYISDPNEIHVGQVIKYMTQQDVRRAQAWAVRRVRDLSPTDHNLEPFLVALHDIEQGRFQFSINDSTGTHANSILEYAAAQGEGRLCRQIIGAGKGMVAGPWRTKEEVEELDIKPYPNVKVFRVECD